MHQIDGYYVSMNKTNVSLAALDLNLITALHALLQHQSVSQAAVSVGRTQSAMSHSLARLRDHFADPILVREGRNMQRTPLAERLYPRVIEAARTARNVFEAERPFDPVTSDRRIRIATPDLCAPLFSRTIASVARTAPGMAVEFLDTLPARQAVLTSNADVGLGFGHPKSDTNLTIVPLIPLDWCTFAPKGHPFAKAPSPETWQDSAHVVVGKRGADEGPVEKASRAHGLTRHVSCYAPNFSAALALARECNALFITLRAPFEAMATKFGLVACPTPMAIGDAPVALVLRAPHGDRFHLWLHQICHDTIIAPFNDGNRTA